MSLALLALNACPPQNWTGATTGTDKLIISDYNANPFPSQDRRLSGRNGLLAYGWAQPNPTTECIQ